jgi:toluene monooxygenase system protein E
VKRQTPVPPRATLKTYSHLAGQRRLPSEYDLATADLLWYPRLRPEVELPARAFTERQQRGSALQCSDWDRFRDPEETTYSRYAERRSGREAFVDGLLQRIEDSGYDAQLPAGALDLFERALSPLRYPLHGLQMCAAYLGSIAPSGRIAICAGLQAADQARRIHRLAYRLAQLRVVRPGLGDQSKAQWQSAPAWQPLRQLVERLLVCWDFGEALAALELCALPLFDELWLQQLPSQARAQGDYLLAEVLGSLQLDSRWHRDFTGALVQLLLADRPENRAALQGSLSRWLRPARAAVEALAELAGGGASAAQAAHERWLGALGLEAA